MKLTYEHVHVIHENHDEAARFYQEILGGRVIDSRERKGAPQTKLMVGGAMLIVRGARPGESPMRAGRLPRLGVDHLGFYVEEGTLATARAMLEAHGISILEEGDLPHLRYLYFEGPDGVVIELMEAKKPRAASGAPGRAGEPSSTEKARALMEMTNPEAEKILGETGLAILPLGSVEQHGAHLPTGTDYYAAESFARRVAAITGGLLADSAPSASRPCTWASAGRSRCAPGR